MITSQILGYNGSEELFEARLNMGLVKPPQQKGHHPSTSDVSSRNLMIMNLLDSLKTLAWPLLSKGPNGKLDPTLIPDVDSISVHTAHSKHIIA